MKKVYIPFIALLIVFGGCARISTLKKAINNSEASRLQAEKAQKANKGYLEEIASLKKDMKGLRVRNEALVEDNIKKTERISSLIAVVKGKATENASLRGELEGLRSGGTAGMGPKEIARGKGGVYEELYKALNEDIVMGSISIIRGPEALSLLISKKALFESKKAGLLPEGKALLQRISSAREGLKTVKMPIHIRPILPSPTGDDKQTVEGLAVKRGSLVARFLNERTDEKEARRHGLPYKETAGTRFSDFAVEIVFPYEE